MFWEQQGIQTFRPTVQITRSQTASQPAFDKHFAQLAEEYGGVHAINLLGTKENEAILTEAYAAHLRALQSAGGIDLGITHYDFHNHVRLTGHDSVVEIRFPVTFYIGKAGRLIPCQTDSEYSYRRGEIWKYDCGCK